jgi:hypothetical protein
MVQDLLQSVERWWLMTSEAAGTGFEEKCITFAFRTKPVEPVLPDERIDWLIHY